MSAFDDIISGPRTHTETRDVVGALDGEWFAQHPNHKQRIRRYVPGEFDNASGGVCGDPGDAFVVLVQHGGSLKTLFPVGSLDKRGWSAGGL
jgi:hypothetical protein